MKRGRNYGQLETRNDLGIFRKGESYSFKLDWQGTNNQARQPASGGTTGEGPDFDDTFSVVPKGDHGGVLLENYDPQLRKLDAASPLLGTKNDVAKTESDFNKQYETKRVVFLSTDLDIVHPVTAGLAENEEDIGDGGYVSVPRLEEEIDVTPKTKLRQNKHHLALENWKFRLKFVGADRFKIFKDISRTQEVISEMTEFKAIEMTELYFQGLKKV